MPTKLHRLSELAEEEPKRQFFSIAHLITPEALYAAFRSLRKDASAGVDGVTYEEYQQDVQICSNVSGVSAMDNPKQVTSRFVEELWNERRLDVADAIFAKDCVTHQLRSGVPADAEPRGPQAIREHVTGWIASFPDLRFSIEQMLSEGDRVVMQLLMEGTHRGAWLGIPASGKKMQIRMFTVHRVVQGKIVEDWVLVESLGFFQQLGVVPNTADLVGNFLRQQSTC